MSSVQPVWALGSAVRKKLNLEKDVSHSVIEITAVESLIIHIVLL